MKNEFKRGVLGLILFSFITGLLVILTNLYTPPSYPAITNWIIWLFFTSTTALIHYMLLSAAQKSPAYFVRSFMGITSLKLLCYLLVIIAYAFLNRVNATVFIISFLAFYLLYSAFEVVLLLKYFRK